VNEIHLTRVATWLVQTVGKSLLAGFGVAVVCAVVAASTGDGMWFGVGAAMGPAVIGFMLWTSTAPLPELEDDEDEARVA
jgi:hypothetical protein